MLLEGRRWLSQFFKHSLICVFFVLIGCGGGGDSAPTPIVQTPQPPPAIAAISPGVYWLALNGWPAAPGSERATMYIDGQSKALYSGTSMGVGTWTYTSDRALVTLATIPRPRDQGTSESFAARGSGPAISLELSPKPGMANAYIGVDDELTRDVAVTAPNVADLPRRWLVRRPFRLNGVTEQYEFSLDMDVSGNLSGADSTGCTFAGSILKRVDAPFYNVAITTSACGASQFYIANGIYRGHAHVNIDNQAPSPHFLVLALHNTEHIGGLGFTVSLPERRPGQ